MVIVEARTVSTCTVLTVTSMRGATDFTVLYVYYNRQGRTSTLCVRTVLHAVLRTKRTAPRRAMLVGDSECESAAAFTIGFVLLCCNNRLLS